MKTTLIMVGKTTNSHIQALIDDYERRLVHYQGGLDVVVIPELRNTKNLNEVKQRQNEADAIMRMIQPSDHVVLLDEHGQRPRSIELANWLQRNIQNLGPRRLVFIIGGPYGFGDSVKSRANELLSLSPLTFSHQMVRLIFIEQLYRAHTIIKGEPYHHE